MRREGWQHGTARSKTTAGPADADGEGGAGAPPAKPSNHSKFTGKCRRARCGTCHSHPVSKSRDKAKGARKLRSRDVALNPRLVAWRAAAGDDVGGSAHRPKYSGLSATAILDQLSERDYRREDDDHEDESDDVLAQCSDAGEEDEDDDEEEFCRVGIVWEYVDGEDWCLVHEMA